MGKPSGPEEVLKRARTASSSSAGVLPVSNANVLGDTQADSDLSVPSLPSLREPGPRSLIAGVKYKKNKCGRRKRHWMCMFLPEPAADSDLKGSEYFHTREEAEAAQIKYRDALGFTVHTKTHVVRERAKLSWKQEDKTIGPIVSAIQLDRTYRVDNISSHKVSADLLVWNRHTRHMSLLWGVLNTANEVCCGIQIKTCRKLRGIRYNLGPPCKYAAHIIVLVHSVYEYVHIFSRCQFHGSNVNARRDAAFLEATRIKLSDLPQEVGKLTETAQVSKLPRVAWLAKCMRRDKKTGVSKQDRELEQNG